MRGLKGPVGFVGHGGPGAWRKLAIGGRRRSQVPGIGVALLSLAFLLGGSVPMAHRPAPCPRTAPPA